VRINGITVIVKEPPLNVWDFALTALDSETSIKNEFRLFGDGIISLNGLRFSAFMNVQTLLRGISSDIKQI
jgi:hypothetical protein